jgi:hypothetical protein
LDRESRRNWSHASDGGIHIIINLGNYHHPAQLSFGLHPEEVLTLRFWNAFWRLSPPLLDLIDNPALAGGAVMLTSLPDDALAAASTAI